MAYKQLKLWFDLDCAELLVQKLKEQDIQIDQTAFILAIKEGIEDLELKDRIELFCDQLNTCLTGDYIKKCHSVVSILGPENQEETGMFTHFYWIMPIAKFVEKYGLDHFGVSIKAIEEITKRNTGEFTIRPFLAKYQQKTLDQMKRWALADNVHLRRLSSEGLRPRLPWASKYSPFIENPSPLIEILEILKDDKSKFVQNSVANAINDIFKDNEDIARKLIDTWAINPSFERAWIIRHAIRNYRKKKIPWALELTERMKKIKNYEDLCEHCFGNLGYYAVSLSMLVFDLGAMLSYLIILGDAASKVLDVLRLTCVDSTSHQE